MMAKLFIAIALLFTLDIAGLSQSKTRGSHDDFIKIFKKAGSWSDDETSVKIKDAKLKSCELSYETLTRTPLSVRTNSSDRAPSFSEKTDVDANANLSKNSINTRFVAFDLSSVDIDEVVVEKGIADGTSFIRFPLRNSSAVITAKSGFGRDVLAISDRNRPTLVVRTDSADEFIGVFITAVRACKT